MKHVRLGGTALFLFLSASAAALDGKALYLENCASCHGASGRGASGPRLAGDASTWPPRLFERAVLYGTDDHGRPLKAPMPHWKDSTLKSDHGPAPTRAEVSAIQRYLKSLK